MQLIQLLTGIDSIVGTPDAADEVDKLECETTLTTFLMDFATLQRTLEKSSILSVEVFHEPSETVNLASVFFSGGVHIGEQFPQILNPGSDQFQVLAMCICDVILSSQIHCV